MWALYHLMSIMRSQSISAAKAPECATKCRTEANYLSLNVFLSPFKSSPSSINLMSPLFCNCAVSFPGNFHFSEPDDFFGGNGQGLLNEAAILGLPGWTAACLRRLHLDLSERGWEDAGDEVRGRVASKCSVKIGSSLRGSSEHTWLF